MEYWNTELYVVAADERTALGIYFFHIIVMMLLEGYLLLENIGKIKEPLFLLIDRSYKDNYTQYIDQTLNSKPVVPHEANRLESWEYDHEFYKKRNEV